MTEKMLAELHVVVIFRIADWSERVKKIAKAWRELSSEEKQPFLVSDGHLLVMCILVCCSRRCTHGDLGLFKTILKKLISDCVLAV